MASQPTPCANLKVAEFNSFIRIYHAYKDIWIPVPGEVLILKHEPTNIKDKSAVAIYNESKVVGHVSYNISLLLSNFLKRECNKGFVEVTGSRVNRRLDMAWKSRAFADSIGLSCTLTEFKISYNHY